MHIRKYEPTDRNEMIKLWQTIFPNEPAHNEPSAVLEAKLKVDDLIFVAEENEKIVGTCMVGYDGHRGWLYSVGVLQEYRRARVGRALVTNAIKALKQLGCFKVNLQIRATNKEVAAFYNSLGFSVEERLSMGARIE